MWPLGSDFKRDVTCGQNQSLTVKSVHKLMTRWSVNCGEPVTQAKLGGDSGGHAHNSRSPCSWCGAGGGAVGSWKHDYRLTFKSAD